MKSGFVKIFAVNLILLVNCFSQTDAGNIPTVYFVDNLRRILPDEKPQRTSSIELFAAKNEYEPFQIVIYGGDNGLRDVTVSVSDLRNSKNRIISSKNIVLYREHYIEVKTPSPKSSLGAGWYPDALIPFLDPYTGKQVTEGRFKAQPFEVGPGKNQPVWIEIYVPADSEAGEYTGTVTVKSQNFTQNLNYKLTVWNFRLPDQPTLRSWFGSFHRIAKAHKTETRSELYKTLEWRYSQALANHRICPLIPSRLYPSINQDGSISVNTETLDELKRWMKEFHITGFPLRLIGSDPVGKDRDKNITYLRQMFTFLKTNGWEKYAYIYVLDEPNDANAYEQVRQRAKLIHEAQPGIKVLCTEQPNPQKPEWGTLVGSVDIWVPLWPLFEEKYIAERLAAGEEVWTYTALCQGGRGKDTPFWQIDFPVLNYRVPMWISYRYGLHGLLYWTTVYWDKSEDVWTNPQTYVSGKMPFNGEGSLFYPGSDVGIDGPVTSIRLKQIREGMEDFEYLELLKKVDKKRADEIVLKIARSWTDWEKRPEVIFETRKQVGNILSR